jgi:hypothetical protein
MAQSQSTSGMSVDIAYQGGLRQLQVRVFWNRPRF